MTLLQEGRAKFLFDCHGSLELLKRSRLAVLRLLKLWAQLAVRANCAASFSPVKGLDPLLERLRQLSTSEHVHDWAWDVLRLARISTRLISDAIAAHEAKFDCTYLRWRRAPAEDQLIIKVRGGGEPFPEEHSSHDRHTNILRGSGQLMAEIYWTRHFCGPYDSLWEELAQALTGSDEHLR